jgi:hypothetical protein
MGGHLLRFTRGDFNYDRSINFDDYALIDLAFNSQVDIRNVIVPEPTAPALMLMSALIASRRRTVHARSVLH